MGKRDLAARPVCAVCGRPVERMTEDDDGEEVIQRAAMMNIIAGNIPSRTP